MVLPQQIAGETKAGELSIDVGEASFDISTQAGAIEGKQVLDIDAANQAIGRDPVKGRAVGREVDRSELPAAIETNRQASKGVGISSILGVASRLTNFSFTIICRPVPSRPHARNNLADP